MKANRLDESAKGVFVIAATPFTDDGELDLDSTDRLVDFYLSCGVHGMTILGVMGEAQKLTRTETLAFAKRVLKRVDGRVPVIAGVTSPGLKALKELAEALTGEGAAGVMLAPQPGLQGDEAVHAHLALSLSTIGSDIAVCLQDFPPVNSVHISVGVVDRLTAEHPNLVMFKHEDNPGLGKLTRLRETAKVNGRRRLSVLVGNGGIYYPLELRRGADGAMTGFAFPEMLVEVYERHAAGRESEAFDIFDSYLPLVRYEQQPVVGLAIRKEILRRRGAIASAHVRKPGPQLSAIDHQELDLLLARLPRHRLAAR